MLVEDLANFKVEDLKSHLSKVNLLTSGNKDALVQRLLSYCNTHGIKTVQQLSDIASDNEVLLFILFSRINLMIVQEEVLTSPQKVRVVTKSNTEKVWGTASTCNLVLVIYHFDHSLLFLTTGDYGMGNSPIQLSQFNAR